MEDRKQYLSADAIGLVWNLWFFLQFFKIAYFIFYFLVVLACATFSRKRGFFCVWCAHGNAQPIQLGPAIRQDLRCLRHAIRIIVWTWCEKKKARGNWKTSMRAQHMHTVCAAGDDRWSAYFMLHNWVRMCHALCWCIWSFVWAQHQRK